MTTIPTLKKFTFSLNWILYEDSDILVVNKPSGLLSVPGRGIEKSHSLYTLLCQYYKDEVFIVHRLDMDTSGIMVVAKNKAAHRALSIQFQERETQKYYEAICIGKPELSKGCINLPMRCDWENRPKQMIDPKQGKFAQTYWEITQQWTLQNTTQNAFKVKLTPITGRSHQLRLHMKTLGHPILGDNLYADQESLQLSNRLLLHATYLAFTHPTTHKVLNFYYPYELYQHIKWHNLC